MSDIIIGGVEGGATHSQLVLYSGDGEKLIQISGPGTNMWLIGMDECQKRLHDMVEEAKEQAGVTNNKPLAALGLSLSGCEQDYANIELQEGLEKKYPNLSKEYVVTSDTVGSIAAAFPNGGIVLIAGTGSNALLLNSDGTVHRCGGLGYMMGDEGSAWWIAHKAIKICVDEQDNFGEPPHPTHYVWETIKKHFNAETRFQLLDHCYFKFDKSKYAALTKYLSEGAEKGDDLCQWLFFQAGEILARHITALFPSVNVEHLEPPDSLSVVCVGSVWLSWKFMRPGFSKQIGSVDSPVKNLNLVRLTISMANGAAYLAADKIEHDLPRNYTENSELFCRYVAQGKRLQEVEDSSSRL